MATPQHIATGMFTTSMFCGADETIWKLWQGTLSTYVCMHQLIFRSQQSNLIGTYRYQNPVYRILVLASRLWGDIYRILHLVNCIIFSTNLRDMSWVFNDYICYVTSTSCGEGTTMRLETQGSKVIVPLLHPLYQKKFGLWFNKFHRVL